MNFIGFVLIAIITFIITTFALTQIIGIILFKLSKKEFNNLVGLLIWIGILIGLFLIINNWFNSYLNVYIVVSIISFIVCLLNIKNLKNEM